jgi:heat shock protein HslJ
MVLTAFAQAVLAVSLSLAAQVVLAPRPLEGTYWKAIELDGQPVPSQSSVHEVYLLLQEEGRFSGSDGCNRVAGLYAMNRTAVRFSDMAVTQMACIDAGDLDVVFHDALKHARRLAANGERLDLFDSANKRVAMFLAVSTRSAEAETH